MKESRVPDTKLKKTYIAPNERVTQARLRLLAAAKMRNENLFLTSIIPSKRAIGIPAIAIAFAAGFISGFYPSIPKAISHQAPSLLRLWLGRQMTR